jgi:hypothetical protein
MTVVHRIRSSSDDFPEIKISPGDGIVDNTLIPSKNTGVSSSSSSEPLKGKEKDDDDLEEDIEEEQPVDDEANE